jgi:N-acetylglucosaminyl-diphospho-decaprenol L-rhamnosyltransferase
MTTQVSVIIVTYNSSHMIEDCLRPLAIDDDIEIIVVDNASSDSSVDLVRELAPNATIIINDENVGFARAVNQAARLATSECLCLLNPDARTSPAEIFDLCNLALARNSIVGPRVIHPESRLKIQSAGKLPFTWRMFTHYSGLSRISGNLDILQGHYLLLRKHQSDQYNVEYVAGACMAVPSSLYRALGGLTERWFMYAEDIEFCYRALRAGHEVILKNSTAIEHAIGSSDSSVRRRVNTAWVVNLYDFYDKDLCKTAPQFYAWGLVVSAGLLTRSLAYLAKSLRKDESSGSWRSESRKFVIYAASVLKRMVEGRTGSSDECNESPLRKNEVGR